MITITKEFTKEQLIEQAKKNIEVLRVAVERVPGASDAAVIHLKLAEITLASLGAEPVAYIFKHPAGKLFWALTDESNKEQADVIPVYAAPPVPVVPEEKPMPNPLSMLEREITQLIGDAQEATVTGYELIAEAWRLMDGQDPKTSDWHSKASKYLNSNIVEKVDDDRIEAVKAVLRRLAGNYPVTPDGWISCSERMPDTKTAVLVAREFDRKGDWRMKWATYIPGHPDANDGWIIPGASWKPSHWMPLPEPPL
ncbi:Prophage protein [Escherichia coli]